jgi:hypothetical protein
MLDGAGIGPKSLFDAFIFQSPDRFGAASIGSVKQINPKVFFIHDLPSPPTYTTETL